MSCSCMDGMDKVERECYEKELGKTENIIFLYKYIMSGPITSDIIFCYGNTDVTIFKPFLNSSSNGWNGGIRFQNRTPANNVPLADLNKIIKEVHFVRYTQTNGPASNRASVQTMLNNLQLTKTTGLVQESYWPLTGFSFSPSANVYGFMSFDKVLSQYAAKFAGGHELGNSTPDDVLKNNVQFEMIAYGIPLVPIPVVDTEIEILDAVDEVPEEKDANGTVTTQFEPGVPAQVQVKFTVGGDLTVAYLKKMISNNPNLDTSYWTTLVNNTLDAYILAHPEYSQVRAIANGLPDFNDETIIQPNNALTNNSKSENTYVVLSDMTGGGLISTSYSTDAINETAVIDEVLTLRYFENHTYTLSSYSSNDAGMSPEIFTAQQSSVPLLSNVNVSSSPVANGISVTASYPMITVNTSVHVAIV